jgi:Uma2 family endonuclease
MSTTKPSPRAPTLADLDALPRGAVGEIIEGVLYTMTKPRMQHQRTTRLIGGRVGDPFDNGINGPGGWWIVVEPGIELPNDTKEISPDVAALSANRLESSDWRIIGTYSGETEARIAPFDAVPLNITSWWPPAAPASSP